VTAVKVKRVVHELFALVAALSACFRACPKLFTKIESTPPVAPPSPTPPAHYDNNVENTCHETTDDIHFEMSDTRNQFVERQNYFHKQSIQGIENIQ
jgi:hypothetical protein